jgi:hypothetical protein
VLAPRWALSQIAAHNAAESGALGDIAIEGATLADLLREASAAAG